MLRKAELSSSFIQHALAKEVAQGPGIHPVDDRHFNVRHKQLFSLNIDATHLLQEAYALTNLSDQELLEEGVVKLEQKV